MKLLEWLINALKWTLWCSRVSWCTVKSATCPQLLYCCVSAAQIIQAMRWHSSAVVFQEHPCAPKPTDHSDHACITNKCLVLWIIIFGGGNYSVCVAFCSCIFFNYKGFDKQAQVDFVSQKKATSIQHLRGGTIWFWFFHICRVCRHVWREVRTALQLLYIMEETELLFYLEKFDQMLSLTSPSNAAHVLHCQLWCRHILHGPICRHQVWYIPAKLL